MSDDLTPPHWTGGPDYGEGLIGRIDALEAENARLCSGLRYISDVAYVAHQSGNQNFEYLQNLARDILGAKGSDRG